jgi:hypothetical protein
VTKIQAKLIQKQDRDDPNSPFHHVKLGNLRALKDFLKANPENIHIRDACGGTLFHTAYIFDQYRVCHWLVENYPKEALHPYSQTVELNPDLEGLPTFKNIPTFVEEEELIRYEAFRSNRKSIKQQLGLKPKLYAVTADKGDKPTIEIPGELMPYTGMCAFICDRVSWLTHSVDRREHSAHRHRSP